MGKDIILYLLTVPVFFGVDMFWIVLVANKFYQKNLHGLLSPQVNWTAAIIFYLLYIVGILVFAVLPAHAKQDPVKALILGAFFGLVAYATYDLTNLATVKGWPLNVTLVDMAWGMVLTGTVSLISFYIAKAVLR